MGASVKNSRVTNTETISIRAKAYDIQGKTIDGNDVLTVYATVKEAIEYARAGNGPSLIECDTYRVLAHNIGDPMTYRTEEEKKEAQYGKRKKTQSFCLENTYWITGLRKMNWIQSIRGQLQKSTMQLILHKSHYTRKRAC